ncbi:hypothetical protein [Plastoroseomonas arctica]|uniref:Uncharacterized protein n=1 Tax=Plastoroseomonas arctica TaxID=1509237 RepID=A0AAF1KPG8_9PROT|nr:hypothetical protein [Plastoroseomonas arctica]MBR0655933.1 hypothetical protein [Plastoroseomonas arctica]
MAQTEKTRTKAAPPAGERAAIAIVEPPAMPLTYGSWMELGLAARQLMAASQPVVAAAAPARRRRQASVQT